MSWARSRRFRSAKQTTPPARTRARYCLKVFAVEEKYDVLISSYLDFEKQILNASASNMVRDYVGYYDFFEVRLGLNICMINLLTSVRMYVDQLGRHVSGCLPGGNDTESAVKALFSAEYDAHTEYRLMEALSNHVQHHGLRHPAGSFPTGRPTTAFQTASASRVSCPPDTTVHLVSAAP